MSNIHYKDINLILPMKAVANLDAAIVETIPSIATEFFYETGMALSLLGLYVDKSGQDYAAIRATTGEMVQGNMDYLIDLVGLLGPLSVNRAGWIEVEQNGRFFMIEYQNDEVSLANGHPVIEYSSPGRVLHNGKRLKDLKEIDVTVRLTIQGDPADLTEGKLQDLTSEMNYGFSYQDTGNTSRIVNTEIREVML